jgi:hypothetical protein
MIKRALTGLVPAIICLTVQAAAPTTAEPNNVAIAMLAPEEQRVELERALGFCAAREPQQQPALESAMHGWIARQSTLLYVSALYRSAARRKSLEAEQSETTRAALKKLLDVDIPRVIASGVDGVIKPLQKADQEKTLERACNAYLQGINAGRFDLKSESPDLVKFMEQSAPSTIEAAEGPP